LFTLCRNLSLEVTDSKTNENAEFLSGLQRVVLACPDLRTVHLKTIITPAINPDFLIACTSVLRHIAGQNLSAFGISLDVSAENNEDDELFNLRKYISAVLTTNPSCVNEIAVRQKYGNVAYFRRLRLSNFPRLLRFELSWETPPSVRQFGVWTMDDTVWFWNALRGTEIRELILGHSVPTFRDWCGTWAAPLPSTLTSIVIKFDKGYRYRYFNPLYILSQLASLTSLVVEYRHDKGVEVSFDSDRFERLKDIDGGHEIEYDPENDDHVVKCAGLEGSICSIRPRRSLCPSS